MSTRAIPTVVILGCDGQVGHALQRSLQVLGRVLPLNRAQADLADPARLLSTLDALAPDVIVNAAAYTAVDRAESEPEAAHRINAQAVAALAGFAAQRAALLVHYSTDYVFDGSGTRAWCEDDPVAPLGVYGASKLAGERAIGAAGGAHLVLRTSWVFSAHGNNFVKTMLRLAREREALSVVDDQMGAPTSAELIADATAFAVHAARRGALASGVWHLAAGGTTSWHGLARHVVEGAQARGASLRVQPEQIRAIPSADYPTPARRPLNSRLDTTRLRAALGLHLPDWRVHVDRALDQLLEPRTP